MQSTYFPFCIPAPITSLKFRPCLVGLGRNSPLVPLSPAYASVKGTTIGNINVKATQSVDDNITYDHEQHLDEEFMQRAGLQVERMPNNIAVIPDGHRRWARQKGLPPKSGHMKLAPVYKEISRLCCKCGIKVLTAYLLSPENMKRSQEIDTFMSLFEEGIRSNLEESMRHDIRLSVIGETRVLPKSLVEAITEAEEKTKANSRLHLILAINYGGQHEILQASRKLCKKVKDGLIQEDEINDKSFEQELGTNICTEFPFPDFMIRFGGELRLSNFLSYQLAYAELYFTDTPFPDFRQEDFIIAMKSYQKRNRRYGV